MRRANVKAAVGAASHGCVYLPRYAAYKDYRAGMSYSLDCFQACYLDAG